MSAMALFSGIVVLMLMVTAEAYVGSSTESSFCTETKECLLYDQICETDHYEVRHYSPTKWVSTDQKAYIMELATFPAFKRLYKYITGSNENGAKIDMTSPVVLKINESKSIWTENAYTLSFLLPSAYQESPPKPENPEVYLTDMPEMNVYVRSFGGWMNCFTMPSHNNKLKKDLEIANAIHEEYFFAVGYNSPWTMSNRHNEIWYQAIGEPVCVPSGK